MEEARKEGGKGLPYMTSEQQGSGGQNRPQLCGQIEIVQRFTKRLVRGCETFLPDLA